MHRGGWGEERFFATWGSFSLFLSLRSPVTELICKDRRADTFPAEAVPRAHPREVYPATSASRALERADLPPSRISSTSSVPPAGITGLPRGDRGFSDLGVPLLPLLPAGGLTTRRSCGPDRSGAAWLCRPRSGCRLAGRPPHPVCSLGAAGASRLLLQSRAPLAHLLLRQLRSLCLPGVKHVGLWTKRLRCEAHPATPLETLQPPVTIPRQPGGGRLPATGWQWRL